MCDNPLFLAFANIFKSFNKFVVNNCMFFFSTLPISSDYLLRRVKFLQGLFRSENILLLKLQKCSGENVLSGIFRDAQLSPDSDLGWFEVVSVVSLFLPPYQMGFVITFFCTLLMFTNLRKCQCSYMLVKTPSGEHLVAYAACYPLNTFIQKNASCGRYITTDTG